MSVTVEILTEEEISKRYRLSSGTRVVDLDLDLDDPREASFYLRKRRGRPIPGQTTAILSEAAKLIRQEAESGSPIVIIFETRFPKLKSWAGAPDKGQRVFPKWESITSCPAHPDCTIFKTTIR